MTRRNRTCASSFDDTVEAISTLRGEGKRVFLHCIAGASRTPTVATAHLTHHEGLAAAEALDRVAAAIPFYNSHNTAFTDALEKRAP